MDVGHGECDDQRLPVYSNYVQRSVAAPGTGGRARLRACVSGGKRLPANNQGVGRRERNLWAMRYWDFKHYRNVGTRKPWHHFFSRDVPWVAGYPGTCSSETSRDVGFLRSSALDRLDWPSAYSHYHTNDCFLFRGRV